MAYQKSRVIQITFYCCPILIKFQPDARLGGIIAAVDNPSIAEPEESLRIITHSGIILQSGQPEFLFMFLQLTWYLLEYCRHFGLLIIRILFYVVTIKCKDIPLNLIHFLKISSLYIFLYRLGHPTYNHVLTEIIHCPTMESTHRLLLFKLAPNVWHHHLVPHCP